MAEQYIYAEIAWTTECGDHGIIIPGDYVVYKGGKKTKTAEYLGIRKRTAIQLSSSSMFAFRLLGTDSVRIVPNYVLDDFIDTIDLEDPYQAPVWHRAKVFISKLIPRKSEFV